MLFKYLSEFIQIRKFLTYWCKHPARIKKSQHEPEACVNKV